MQQESLTVSRRAMDIEDYIDVARRHKAWIFGPAFAALVISVVVAFLWPDTYLSTAIIRVVPPSVPESYIPPNITSDMQSRINSLAQLILNRSALTALVNKHGLYKKELSRLPTDDVIETMKNRDIRIGPIQTMGQAAGGKQVVPAFMIGFQYNNRMIAHAVTDELVSNFLAESTRLVTDQSISTTELLQKQFEDAKAKLAACDQALQSFRVSHLGRLPDQQTANYSQVNSLQAQMLNVDAQINRVQQDKLQLDSEMRIAKTQLSQLRDPNNDVQVVERKNEKLAIKDKEIEAAETYLARLRERYKETYPDVENAVQQVKVLKRQRDEIAKEESAPKTESRPVSPNPQFLKEQQGLQAAIQRIASMQETKDLQMKEMQKQAAALTDQLRGYQSRIEAVPLGEKEYTELVANRELALKEYQEADQKYAMSQRAVDVMRRSQGEKLQILDPANIPMTPTEPKRYIIISVGSALGLVLGLVLAGAREVKDTSLKNLKDVRAYTQLQVLGSIPLLENDLVVRRRRRLGWLAWSTACLVGVVVMSSSVVYYYATRV